MNEGFCIHTALDAATDEELLEVNRRALRRCVAVMGGCAGDPLDHLVRTAEALRMLLNITLAHAESRWAKKNRRMLADPDLIEAMSAEPPDKGCPGNDRPGKDKSRARRTRLQNSSRVG